MREIITVPGAGHTPPEEKPEEINAIVLKVPQRYRQLAIPASI
jgi:pimeloyl-ACP methyl ester carboxylesterase